MSSAGQEPRISPEDVQRLFERLQAEAENAGYHLNPDVDFTKGLVEGLLINEARYGYWACPCRLPSGSREQDLDIICPCDYRDPDLDEYDTCYCGLYVSQDVVDGKKKVRRIPERRPEELSEPSANPRATPPAEPPAPGQAGSLPDAAQSLGFPVWRCKVCGYLCARAQPPLVCPICRAKKERFERFL